MFAFFSLKRRLFLIVLGGLIASLVLLYMMSSAFASTLTSNSVETRDLQGPPPSINHQQNSQFFHGVTNADNHAIFLGRNQGNSGNQGLNRGDSQDTSLNGANSISSQHKPIGIQQNDQLIQGNGGSGSGNSATFVGSNQGNSGNEGWNSGNNQDNANNAGNQVNNQASTIGTQINAQSSEVNNQGSVIGHQVDNISLLPGLGVSLTVRPRLQLALNVGRGNASSRSPIVVAVPNTGTQDTLAQPAQQNVKVAPPRR